VALVTGTNGKTTTTRLLAVALEAGSGVPVLTNATGSNMPAGHAAALVDGPLEAPAVLEVDEGYLPALLQASSPQVAVLLNLSRDQLDRTNEVRMLAARWREALGVASAPVIVANADDPLVVWGAASAARVVWVAAGLRWRSDATGCPACGGRISFVDGNGTAAAGPNGGARGGWSCRCGFSRPAPEVWITDGSNGPLARFADGRTAVLALALPGSFNRANALMAATAAGVFGVPSEVALGAMAAVHEVAGRFTTASVGGVHTRLLLAKNPAGWDELLELVCPGTSPVVVGINARVADGRDPSWLWDVPFETLAGRPVVATGERCLDLSVRLQYAGVDHTAVRDQVEAVLVAAREAGRRPGRTVEADTWRVEYIGNYTAFHDLYARR
jgi:UDP-N-acetylmuramyl tripeptide synthase